LKNTHIWFVLVGWVFLFYLNNRTLRRSEIVRLKENLTKDLVNLFDWLNETVSQQALKALELEDELATKVSLIEFRARQFEDYAKLALFDPPLLADIRSIDTAQLIDVDTLTHTIHLQQYDILETIEQSYHQHYFKKNVFARLWLNRKPQLAAMVSMLSIFVLVSELWGLAFN
jgi:hypothetical protein